MFDAQLQGEHDIWDAHQALWFLGSGVVMDMVGLMLLLWLGKVQVLEQMLVEFELVPLVCEGGLYGAFTCEFDVWGPGVLGVVDWDVGELAFLD